MKKLLSVIFLLLIALSVSINAQEVWPTREVTIIVSWSAGGATDLLFRAVGKYFPKYANGQQLIIKNVPGGGAAIGYGEAAKAKPDGYTLVAAANPMVTRALMGAAPYDPIKSFEPVCLLVNNPCYIIVNSKTKRWKNLNEFMQDAKQNPGIITVGNGGAGGGTHLVALKFENKFKVKFNHVPFSGGAPAVTALLGGHIDSYVGSAPEGLPNVDSGELEILAVFSEKRLKNYPKAPTAKEQGYDFVDAMWRGVSVPKGTPIRIINRINEIMKAILADPEFQKDADKLSQDLTYLGPTEFRKLIISEYSAYKGIVEKYNLGDFYK
ncbi:MAG TPA: tripartite tricarboxylate transporter substrate binding protein [Dictyoglomaceae bacterium]|nr:tripartite tricarboxylate transporter substrate binding protein [Dictyoglomaceae bacterium]HOL39859.1 tripartite tricarboxylate transporter substrate binding protein [Dictyoglomaceae bacterium]HOP95550.1 tripartite tricarboxylate transporter substrate binding protein [Dictyoglomaceae bacterium]HPP16346.1 tripartite tricarboxylate transporter substrate binding protein [Dictyoglomaceae bacterium]HPU43416.1 tripartite tricarboxylate transporter substrate binding protein [Dictyoglomaceae bacteri